MGGLLQNRDFARAVNDAQLVGESFPFSQRDYAILFFFCLVHYLDCLPKGDMAFIITSKDTVKQSRSRQEADVPGVQWRERAASCRHGLSKEDASCLSVGR